MRSTAALGLIVFAEVAVEMMLLGIVGTDIRMTSALFESMQRLVWWYEKMGVSPTSKRLDRVYLHNKLESSTGVLSREYCQLYIYNFHPTLH